MPRIPVALVGAGWIVEQVYVPLLAADDSLQVVTVFDRDRRAAESVARRLGAIAVDRFDESLDSRVDAAVICTPPQSHLDMILATLARGKHILCEKPVIRTKHEATAVLSNPRSATRLMGSSSTRLRADVQLMLSWAQQQVGVLQRIQLRWLRGAGVPAPGSWRTDCQVAASGVLEDLGPHLLDLAAAVLPRCELTESEILAAQLECRFGSQDRSARWYSNAENPGYTVPDYASATFRDPSGVLIDIELSWAGAEVGDITELCFSGTRGTAAYHGLFGFSPAARYSTNVCKLSADGQACRLVKFSAGAQRQLEGFRRSLKTFAAFCREESRAVADCSEVARVAVWIDEIAAAAGHEQHTHTAAAYLSNRPGQDILVREGIKPRFVER